MLSLLRAASKEDASRSASSQIATHREAIVPRQSVRRQQSVQSLHADIAEVDRAAWIVSL
jgi:hypothetical protein